MILKPRSLAFAAGQAFTDHVGRLPDTDASGEAIEAWANRAAELSRTAADAGAEYADESYRLGLITADLLFGRLIEVEAFHSRNQRIVREGLAAVARAREDSGQAAGSRPRAPEAAHVAPGQRHRRVRPGATAAKQL